MTPGRTSAAGALLPVVTALGLLAACGRQPTPTQPERPEQAERADTGREQAAEVEALVAATKQHPSLVNKEEAGPPIHVTPFTKPGAALGHQHPAK